MYLQNSKDTKVKQFSIKVPPKIKKKIVLVDRLIKCRIKNVDSNLAVSKFESSVLSTIALIKGAKIA